MPTPDQLPKIYLILACIAAYTLLEYLRVLLPITYEAPVRFAEGAAVIGLIVAGVLMGARRKG